MQQQGIAGDHGGQQERQVDQRIQQHFSGNQPRASRCATKNRQRRLSSVAAEARRLSQMAVQSSGVRSTTAPVSMVKPAVSKICRAEGDGQAFEEKGSAGLMILRSARSNGSRAAAAEMSPQPGRRIPASASGFSDDAATLAPCAVQAPARGAVLFAAGTIWRDPPKRSARQRLPICTQLHATVRPVRRFYHGQA